MGIQWHVHGNTTGYIANTIIISRMATWGPWFLWDQTFTKMGVQPTTRGNSSCMIGISRDMEVGQMGLYHLYTFIYYAQILLGAIYTLDTLKYTWPTRSWYGWNMVPLVCISTSWTLMRWGQGKPGIDVQKQQTHPRSWADHELKNHNLTSFGSFVSSSNLNNLKWKMTHF